MKNKVLIIDTSMLCCLLQVPSKDTCGTTADQWNDQRVTDLIEAETNQGAILVLPLATIIETGNHIAQAPSRRYECAKALAEIMQKAADQKSPWAAFSDQSTLWDGEGLKRLSEEWPSLAIQEISIGDATIKTVADYYAKMGSVEVEILTGDAGLKAYQPLAPAPAKVPRRRQK